MDKVKAIKVKIVAINIFFAVGSGAVNCQEIDFTGSTDLLDSSLSLSLEDGVEETLLIAESLNLPSSTQSTIEIAQNGSDNRAISIQTGLDNHSTIIQLGDNNLAFTFQDGESNEVNIEQDGTYNISEVHQYGVGNVANIEQTGHGNFYVLKQIGDYGEVTIQQF